ncbi:MULTISPECIES: SIS domain-containing protein [Streptomyces]|uniref:SIS domain-containing protein n=1 Tax=Streptomyces TaxID=1883 RepID=UPI001E42761E|nr:MULTISPECIES: SIS domain-containing protein [Streptomyces]UFQ16021.1 mannose-6-phosphate isomerase [Streptomyces huasconensis]WCL85624.1 SIS domain-containing protein [Streptomyces sp. JCM 35825]
MLDESLLDDPEALARADRRGLLRGAAEAGARVRTAVRHAAEAGLTELKPDGRPRAILIAGPGTAAVCVADLLDGLAGASCPVVRLAPTGVAPAAGALRWTLPGWAGPVDLLLLATPDGTEPGLSLLAEQAYRRGCTVVAVAPARTPLAESVEGSHGLTVPLATSPYGAYEGAHDEATREAASYEARRVEDEAAPGAPCTLWALIVPLLVLLDRTGLITAPVDTLQKVADRLDRVAERCGPAIGTYSNPAKTLAAELADALPLIWTEGQSAGVAGRRFAATLAELAGHAALAAELPEALPAHGALLAGNPAGGDADDFFRDRVDDQAALRARVVLLRDRPVDLGGLTAAPAARELAHGHDVALSELEPEATDELEALAELIAVTDFAAVYLALASGGRS